MEEFHGAVATRPRILVIWESKRGTTADISYVIAEELRKRGLRVTLADAAKGYPGLEFDAYVIGSDMHRGRWMKNVKQFARDARRTLLSHPAWLFSVVLTDHTPTPDDAPLDISDLFWSAAPMQDRLFAGNLDPAKLSLAERLSMAVRRVSYGDYRDWDAIRNWAQDIATAMSSTRQGGRSHV